MYITTICLKTGVLQKTQFQMLFNFETFFAVDLVRGGSPCFFVVKLDFDIAVDQQTKAHNRTFEVVPDSGCQPVPAGQPRPYLVNFGSIFPNHLNMLKTVLWVLYL